MDNCELDKVLLSVYLDKELEPKEIEKVEKHLKEHPDCASELEALKKMDKELKTLPKEKLPENFELKYDKKPGSVIEMPGLAIFNRVAAVIFLALAVLIVYDKFMGGKTAYKVAKNIPASKERTVEPPNRRKKAAPRTPEAVIEEVDQLEKSDITRLNLAGPERQDEIAAFDEKRKIRKVETEGLEDIIKSDEKAKESRDAEGGRVGTQKRNVTGDASSVVAMKETEEAEKTPEKPAAARVKKLRPLPQVAEKKKADTMPADLPEPAKSDLDALASVTKKKTKKSGYLVPETERELEKLERGIKKDKTAEKNADKLTEAEASKPDAVEKQAVETEPETRDLEGVQLADSSIPGETPSARTARKTATDRLQKTDASVDSDVKQAEAKSAEKSMRDVRGNKAAGKGSAKKKNILQATAAKKSGKEKAQLVEDVSTEKKPEKIETFTREETGSKKRFAARRRQGKAVEGEADRYEGLIPAGAVRGEIIVYDRESKTVLINVGERSGVKPKERFWIYRKGKCIGTIKVDTVYTKQSFCSTEISFGSIEFKKNDMVVNRQLDVVE